MADNIPITAGAGTTVHADEYTHGTLGSGKTQLVKLVDGTLNSDTPAVISAAGLKVDLGSDNDVVADITNDYTREVGRVKIVNDAGTVIDLTEDVAHDAADSGAPSKIGFKARDALSDVTMVAEDDRTDAYAGLDGVLAVRPHALAGDWVREVDTNTNGTSTAFGSGLAAPGAGISICVTDVTLTNSSATDITVDLRDGVAGSVIWTFPVPANGGVTHSFGVPLQLTANTALAYDGSAAATTLTIACAGFLTRI